jgi:hypothetical protein
MCSSSGFKCDRKGRGRSIIHDSVFYVFKFRIHILLIFFGILATDAVEKRRDFEEAELELP